MKISAIFLVFAAMPLVASASAADPAELKLESTPLRAAFHKGEPVAVGLVVSNTTDRPLQVICGFGHHIDVLFSCEGVPPTRPAQDPDDEDRLAAARTLGPKQSFRRVVALNRFLAFSKVGTYRVNCRASYSGRVADARGNGRSRPWRDLGAETTVRIVIEAGDIDSAWIKSLIADLEGKHRTAPRKAAASRQPPSVEEAAELLCWADTPTVIEPLVAAAKDPAMPNLARDVIPALQKFFKKNDGAKKGILEIAAATGTVSDAIAVFDKEGETIHSEWFKPIFASKSIMSIWPSLEYIRKHGTRDDVEAVEPLVNNDFSPQIGQLAAAVVKDLKARPPAKSPAAPGQEKK